MPRVLLAGLWIVLGGAKALHAGTFVSFLGDQGVPEALRQPLAGIVIGGEVLLGLALLLATRWARSLAALSLSLSILMSVYWLVEPQAAAQCGCFGNLVRATRARRLVVLGALCFLSAQLLRRARSTGLAAITTDEAR